MSVFITIFVLEQAKNVVEIKSNSKFQLYEPSFLNIKKTVPTL